MSNKKGFVIPISLILILSLSVIVASMLVLSTTSVKKVGTKADQLKAFNIAEAGLNKAIWYLSTDPAEGGKGINWRTSGLTENFGGGSYTMIIEDDPVGMKITITATYTGTSQILQVLASEDFSDIYRRYTLTADSDLEIAEGAGVEEGTVAVTEGHSITGEGSYSIGSTAAPEPTIDTTYYTNKINYADSGADDVVKSSTTYTDLDLNGSTIYVDGTVTLKGSLIGAGEIITTANIRIDPTATIGENIKLVAQDNLYLDTGAVLQKDVTLYAGELIQIESNLNLDKAIVIITPKETNIGDYTQIDGVLNVGKLAVGRDVIIEGKIAIGSMVGKHSFDTSTFIDETYDQVPPPGFEKTVKIREWLKK